jgi:hypothetical protein
MDLGILGEHLENQETVSKYLKMNCASSAASAPVAVSVATTVASYHLSHLIWSCWPVAALLLFAGGKSG